MKVLHVEDNQHDVIFIDNMLRDKAEITVVSTIKEAEEQLNSNVFDVMLLDLALEDGESSYMLDMHSLYLPIIVITGSDDEDRACRCIRHGAQDYLIKNQFDKNLLWKSMLYAQERFGKTKLQQAQKHFKKSLTTLQDTIKNLKDYLDK